MAYALVHVGVEVGDGLVARFGDALLLVVDPGQHRERAEDLLAAVEAATSGPGPAGESVANRLAAIVASREPGTTPPFGAVAPLAEGFVVLLHGPVSAEIASPLGVVQLSGEQAVTWVDHKVEVAVDRLSVTSRDHPVQVDPMSDLRAGLVPGNGFVVTPGRSSEDGAPRATAAQRAAAQGNRSARAGSEPIGHLVARDGLRIPLDRSYVVGREPEADPAVTSGTATPVRLSDDENLISRVHSYITVEDGQVSLRDASSANGTFLAAPGDDAWTRVGEEQVELPPAWSMRVGNQVFTYVAAAAAP